MQILGTGYERAVPTNSQTQTLVAEEGRTFSSDPNCPAVASHARAIISSYNYIDTACNSLVILVLTLGAVVALTCMAACHCLVRCLGNRTKIESPWTQSQRAARRRSQWSKSPDVYARTPTPSERRM